MHPLPMTIALASMLAACAASSGSGEGNRALVRELVRVAPPADLTRPCAPPVALPDAPLSAGAVERGWARDRVSLASCAGRHGALVGFILARDKAADMEGAR